MLLVLAASVSLVLGCESQKSDDESGGGGGGEPTAQPAETGGGASDEGPVAVETNPAPLESLDFDAPAKTLTATLLNPYGSRNLALADVAGRVWGAEQTRGERPEVFLERLCLAVVEGGCAPDKPELHYFEVLAATVEQLGKAAEAQGKTEASAALSTWAGRTREMANKGLPVTVPMAAEPLADLGGDPVLVVRGTDEDSAAVDILVGPAVVRTIEDALAEESPARLGLLESLDAGQLFTVAGLVAPPDTKIEPQPGTPLRILVPADAPFGPALALLRKAYDDKKIQKMELVLRSDEYQTLSALPLNVVNASARGADHGVVVTREQVTWREETDGGEEKVEGVGWDTIERLGEVARQPRGQLVLYVEVAEDITGAQLARALSALRARCGDQVMCPNLQLALALKPTGG